MANFEDQPLFGDYVIAQMEEHCTVAGEEPLFFEDFMAEAQAGVVILKRMVSLGYNFAQVERLEEIDQQQLFAGLTSSRENAYSIDPSDLD